MRTNPLTVHETFSQERKQFLLLITITIRNERGKGREEEERKVQMISQPVDHAAWLFGNKTQPKHCTKTTFVRCALRVRIRMLAA